MTSTSGIVRIFISSPGDVIDERDRARRVIDGLQRHYPGATLQPVLWEELALPATDSFQESIDFLLKREPIDVAVFILWSRLGTPLGAATTRLDGTPYRSGTEREFDLMLAAYEQSGRKHPVILAYARDDDAGWRQKLTESPASELEKLIAQQNLLNAFIREQFSDADGRNVRALLRYREPVEFAQRLRAHLRQALDGLLGADAAPRWLEEPYRGLEVFDIRHAPIFHGRDKETCDLLQCLRDQERAGCAFVVIVGASGSGKSSLARAGVAANLVEHAGGDGVTEWRTAFFLPALGAGSLSAALTRTLAEALPELGADGGDQVEIAAGLAKDPALTVKLSIAPAFARAAKRLSGPSTPEPGPSAVRLLLVLDQMEELWTDRRITAEELEQFLRAIEALACSRHVAVLATLRSDFYSHAHSLPSFLRLKGKDGQFDLLPPGPAALGRLVTEPARLAGLRFERDEASGITLDEVILDEVILQDAARSPAALPLLQYTLAELYQLRDVGQRRLTFAAYEQLGGVEGALGRRAEQTYLGLPDDAQAALADILPLLVTVGPAADQASVRRRAMLADVTATPARRRLTEFLIAARFLTTDHDGDVPIVRLAHEALLGCWNRIADWIEANRKYLRLRSSVEASQQRWEAPDPNARQHDRDASLLLRSGLPLEEGRELIREAPDLLTAATTDYIRASIRHDERLAHRTRLRRLVVVAVLSLAAIVTTFGAVLAWRKQLEADRQRDIANQKATEAAGNLKRVEAEQRKSLAAAKAERHAKEQAVAQRERAERQLYHSQIYRAAGEIEAGRHVQAAEILAAIPFAQRQWEARYFSRQAEGTPLTLYGHEGGVNSVAVSPDGRRIVSGSWDRAAKVWDAKTGTETLTLRGHEGGVTSVAFSPDGRRIVSGSGDNTMRVWDAETGTELVILRGHKDNVTSVAFSRDGRRIVSGSWDQTVIVWDAGTGTETLTLRGHEKLVESVAFSPDGRRIASGSEDNTVKVWDVETGTETLTLRGNVGEIASVAFSPDGRRIVSGGSRDDTVRVWEAETGTETLTLRGHECAVTSVAFSPDGRRIVSAGGLGFSLSPVVGTVKVWDAETGTEILTLRGHKNAVASVAFSPDGRRIVSGSWDHTVKVWDAEMGTEMLSLRHENEIASVAFSPDGLRIASGSWHDTVKVWDAETGTETLTLRGHEDAVVTSVAFSPDGRRIVNSMDRHSSSYRLPPLLAHTLEVWDVETGTEILTLRGHGTGTASVAFSPDGRRIVSGGGKDILPGTVQVWDAEMGTELLALRGHKAGIASVAFSPDGRRIVSGGSRDDPVRVWDAEKGMETLALQGHENAVVTSVVFSPDGRRIIAGGSGIEGLHEAGTVKVWDAELGTASRTLRGHENGVTSVAFSPDGRRIISGSSDRTVKVWDAETGTEMLSLRGHKNDVTSVAFSPDGRRIVSGGGRGFPGVGIVEVWDAATGTETLTLGGHEKLVSAVAFSPDGRRIVSRDQSGRELVWDTATGELIEGEPRPKTLDTKVISPDGLLHAVPNRNRIDLIRKTPGVDLWAEDVARRAAWEPVWCERDAAACEAAENWFAARFHLRRLSQLKPNDESVRTRLKHAEASLAAESRHPVASERDAKVE